MDSVSPAYANGYGEAGVSAGAHAPVFATPRPAGTPLARGEFFYVLLRAKVLLWPEEYGEAGRCRKFLFCTEYVFMIQYLCWWVFHRWGLKALLQGVKSATRCVVF